MSIDDEDLRDVIAEETQSRRRRTGDAETRRQNRRLLAAFRKALEECDEGLFLQAIRKDLGLKDGSPEFLNALRVWRAFRGKL